MKRLAIVLVGLLLFTGCKVRIHLDTTINADESGRVAFAIGFDEEFRQALESFGEGFGEEGGDPFADIEESAPEGWEVERFTDGEFEGVRISRDFDDLEDLRAALEETESFGETGNDLGAGAGTPGFESFGVERDGDIFTVEVGPEGFDVPSASDGEDPFAGEGSPFGELEFEAIISFTLPGKVIEHNADEVDGSTVTWRFTQESEPQPIRAVSDASQSAGDSDFPIVPVVIIAALVLGGGLFLLLRSRQAPAVAGPGPESPIDGEPPPPPPPPPPSE